MAYRRQRAIREKHRVREPLENFTEDGRHRFPVKRWVMSPDQPVLDKERAEVIERAIAQLPEMYRDVFVLADVEELPNVQSAEILGLSVMAVKSRLHRARLWMRNALAPYFEEAAA